jgi:hypothetical protein
LKKLTDIYNHLKKGVKMGRIPKAEKEKALLHLKKTAPGKF